MQIPQPLSREQAKQGNLIPAGTYIYEVLEAIDDFSKTTGNEQIKLKLKIYMPDGKERMLYDYLTPAFEFKLAHFCEANGLWEKYEAGDISADDCFGKSGECKIYIQKGKNGYSDQSSIGDYLLNDEQTAAKHERKIAEAKQVKQDNFDDQNIPF